jgi:transposase
MARYERNYIEQGEFLAINIHEQFNETSREYHIKDFINKYTDLSIFEAYYKNDETGRKCKDPRDMISAILYGYCTGNHQSRKIEELLKTHIGFMFVSNRLQVDHSVICEFKTNFKEEISRLFSTLLYVLNNIEEIDWELVVGDGTKIKASAAKWRNVGGEFTEKKLGIYRKMAQNIITRDLELEEKHLLGEISDKAYKAEKPRISRQKKLYDAMVGRIEEYQNCVNEGKLNGKERYNLIDPESKVMTGSDPRIFIQGYDYKMMISNNDIILDYKADTKSQKNAAGEMIKRVEGKKNDLGVRRETKYLLDAGFQDMQTIIDCENDGLDLYIDLQKKDYSNDVSKRKYFNEAEKKGDRYYLSCIGNRERRGTNSPKVNDKIYFHFPRSGCNGCSHYQICYKNIKATVKRKSVSFRIFELEHRKEIDEYLNKLRSEEGKKIYHKRIGKEHNFANIKTQKNYYQTSYRGMIKVNMEFSWIALAHNLMKYVNYRLSSV